MSRGDCGDLLKVSVTCTAYEQTQALLLKVVAMLKVMKLKCHLPIWLNFTFQTTTNLSEKWRGSVVGLVAIGSPERHVRKASHRGSKQQ